MVCEICRKNQVSFIISAFVDSRVMEMCICEDCATRTSTALQHPWTAARLVPAKAGVRSGTGFGQSPTKRQCAFCHSEFQQIEHALLLGCPMCYTEFHEELAPLLRRIHGSVTHKGKVANIRSVKFPSIDADSSRLPAGCSQGRLCSDVVISSRIRLARNLDGHLFCNTADESELSQVIETVCAAVKRIPSMKNARVIDIDDLDHIDRELLIERHIISRDLAEKESPRRVIIGEGEIASIMLNEEDHIRLQVIDSGLQIGQLWSIINNIDVGLGSKVDYAVSKEWGYLTACPTNVGTGLRVSVMFHIPALSATRTGHRVLSSISDMGYTVRGIYGEGSQAVGAFYQISNGVTLGRSEEEIIDSIRSVAFHILEREREERLLLVEKNRIGLEDKVFRSLGTLTSARAISSREALELLSWTKLGVDLGMLPELDKVDIAQLLILINPAHLQKLEGKHLNALDRDINRAKMIRTVFQM